MIRRSIMTHHKHSDPKIAERPDKAAAERDPKGPAEDRPGFDLGGAVEPENKRQSQLPPRGPAGSPAAGGTETGRAAGLTDPSGSRSLGNEGGEPGLSRRHRSDRRLARRTLRNDNDGKR
jgi:hypothetical protein